MFVLPMIFQAIFLCGALLSEEQAPVSPTFSNETPQILRIDAIFPRLTPDEKRAERRRSIFWESVPESACDDSSFSSIRVLYEPLAGGKERDVGATVDSAPFLLSPFFASTSFFDAVFDVAALDFGSNVAQGFRFRAPNGSEFRAFLVSQFFGSDERIGWQVVDSTGRKRSSDPNVDRLKIDRDFDRNFDY